MIQDAERKAEEKWRRDEDARARGDDKWILPHLDKQLKKKKKKKKIKKNSIKEKNKKRRNIKKEEKKKMKIMKKQTH